MVGDLTVPLCSSVVDLLLLLLPLALIAGNGLGCLSLPPSPPSISLPLSGPPLPFLLPPSPPPPPRPSLSPEHPCGRTPLTSSLPLRLPLMCTCWCKCPTTAARWGVEWGRGEGQEGSTGAGRGGGGGGSEWPLAGSRTCLAMQGSKLPAVPSRALCCLLQDSLLDVLVILPCMVQGLALHGGTPG